MGSSQAAARPWPRPSPRPGAASSRPQPPPGQSRPLRAAPAQRGPEASAGGPQAPGACAQRPCARRAGQGEPGRSLPAAPAAPRLPLRLPLLEPRFRKVSPCKGQTETGASRGSAARGPTAPHGEVPTSARLFQKHCELSAFSCFQSARLRLAQAAAHQGRVPLLTKQLKRKLPLSKARGRSEREPTCPSCDSYEKKPPAEFLQRLKELLQRMIVQRLS